MSEKKDLVEFKLLDAKLKSQSNIVVFELEDGAIVKVKVDIARAGVATNFKNPDGSSHYNVGLDAKITITPPGKTFYIPKDQLPTQAPTHAKQSTFVA